MGTFNYSAVTLSGKKRSGSIEAPNKKVARSKLMAMKLRVLKIVEDAADTGDVEKILGDYIVRDHRGAVQINLVKDKPTTKHLVVFTKQFSTMLTSGVPLVQTLNLLANQQQSPMFRNALHKIRITVENGATLSEALEGHKDIFDELYVAMIRAGEASGNLDVITAKLVTYIERAAKIKSQVKSAMMYPSIILVVAVSVVAALLIFVVPTFAEQYEQNNQELPALTQIVIDFSNGVVDNWFSLLAFLVLSVFLSMAFVKNEHGRKIFDAHILKIPVLGELLRKIAVGRFCSTMASMLTAGVNLLEALTICAASSGNKTIEEFILGVRTGLEQGQKFSEPLGEGDLMPEMVVSMVSVGEATGSLDDMLGKVSEFYEEEVDIAVAGLLSMIEPIMIIGIGCVVGFIVLAMYLPVFDMASNVS